VLARTWQIGTTTKQRILNPTVSHFKVVAIRSFLGSLSRPPFGFRSFPSGSLRLRLWSFPPICHRKPSYASQCFISSQCVCFIHISSPIFTPVIHPVSAKKRSKSHGKKISKKIQALPPHGLFRPPISRSCSFHNHMRQAWRGKSSRAVSRPQILKLLGQAVACLFISAAPAIPKT